MNLGFLGCWGTIASQENRQAIPSRTGNDARFWCKIDLHPSLLSHFVTKVWSPPGPKAQENEFPLEGSCHCSKPKNLPVRTTLLMQNTIKTTCAILAYWKQFDRPPSARSSVACELPEWSMWSLASSAQNCTGYIKTFCDVMIFKPPPPYPFRHKRHYPLPQPWSMTSDMDDPKACCIDFWSTVTFVFKIFVFGQ